MKKIHPELIGMKRRCRRCKKEQDLTEFYKLSRKSPDGVIYRRHICRDCLLLEAKVNYRRKIGYAE